MSFGKRARAGIRRCCALRPFFTVLCSFPPSEPRIGIASTLFSTRRSARVWGSASHAPHTGRKRRSPRTAAPVRRLAQLLQRKLWLWCALRTARCSSSTRCADSSSSRVPPPRVRWTERPRSGTSRSTSRSSTSSRSSHNSRFVFLSFLSVWSLWRLTRCASFTGSDSRRNRALERILLALPCELQRNHTRRHRC